MTWYSTRELEAFRRQGFTVEGNLAGRPYIEKRAPNGSYERIYTDGGGPTRCAAVIFPKRPVAPSQDEAPPATPQPQRKQPARRHARQPIVTFADGALGQVRRLAGFSMLDGKESAGVLLGRVLPEGRVEVCSAVRSDSKRTRNSAFLDPDPAHGRIGLRPIGCWHTHPGPGGTPSATDRRAWKRFYCRRRAETGQLGWVSLIAPSRGRGAPLAYLTNLRDGTKPIALT